MTPILYKCSDIDNDADVCLMIFPSEVLGFGVGSDNEDFFINIRVDVVSGADVWLPSPTHC